MTVFEALADPTRRKILDELRETGPLSVTELAEPLPITRQAVTKHLDALEASGLIRSWREGRRRRTPRPWLASSRAGRRGPSGAWSP